MEKTKEQEVIDTHFYKSERKVKEDTAKRLKEDLDNHIGRVRDNRYDKEQFYIDERYEQW